LTTNWTAAVAEAVENVDDAAFQRQQAERRVRARLRVSARWWRATIWPSAVLLGGVARSGRSVSRL
jgi:hypothetical protein